MLSLKVQARDTSNTHIVFCLRCRPSTSSVSFLTGVLVTLQYLLVGPHRIALGIHCQVLKRIGAYFFSLLSKNKRWNPL
jgi:hypothetical protein